jgi:hypothetical protein
MCYVCRKDIGKESYAHFCQHFRELPGRACGECSKCDLYKTESEDLAVRRAARKARQEYLAAHPEVQNQMERSDDYAIGPPTATEAICKPSFVVANIAMPLLTYYTKFRS